MMAIGAMAIAAVLGLIFSQTLSVSADPDLSEENVREMVKAQYPGEIATLELASSDDGPMYNIEIEIDGKAYHLTMDGNSGEVLQLDEKSIIATEDQNKTEKQEKTDVVSSNKKEESSFEMKEKIEREKPQDNEKTTAPAKKENEQTNEQDKNQEEEPKEKSEDDSESEKSTISPDRAIEIALSQFSGQVEDVELDADDGRLIYEIEIESSRGDAEIEIDAYTGEVIVADIDLDD